MNARRVNVTTAQPCKMSVVILSLQKNKMRHNMGQLYEDGDYFAGRDMIFENQLLTLKEHSKEAKGWMIRIL